MLEIVVWDVQHGSAAYINTPDGRHIVVDLGAGGENGGWFSPLQTLRSNRGVHNLDAVIVTHPHRDHLEDIVGLLDLCPKVLCTPRHLTDQEIREGNRAGDMPFIESYLVFRRMYSTPPLPGMELERPMDSTHAGIHVFSPMRASRKNLNDHSLVLVVSYAGLKILIPGDNESASWRELLENPIFVSAIKGADVVIASHHGRESGYCPELFAAIGRKPRLVVVSDGPFSDTSATSKYCSRVTGWTVFDPSGTSEERYCVTTRKDRHITIKCGWTPEGSNVPSFLNVTTSKTFERSFFSNLAALGYGSGPIRS